MPLVRIDVIEGRRTPDELRRLADTVQEDGISTVTGTSPGITVTVLAEAAPAKRSRAQARPAARARNVVVMVEFPPGRAF